MKYKCKKDITLLSMQGKKLIFKANKYYEGNKKINEFISSGYIYYFIGEDDVPHIFYDVAEEFYQKNYIFVDNWYTLEEDRILKINDIL